jgi:fatty acid desaturase
MSASTAPMDGPDERLRRFGDELDRLRARVEARVGAEDVRYITRVRRVSTAMQITGRALIHFSPEPLTFLAGVGALWLHLQLEAIEIGHTALHGAFDGLEGAERFRSDRFRWLTPIDEESWKYSHNVRHHTYTNITAKDPDLNFGPVRLTGRTPYSPVRHRFQRAFMLLEWLSFGFVMHLHVTRLVDLLGVVRPHDLLKAQARPGVRDVLRRVLRKFPYFVKNYVFFPALAGPLFWKVMLGNWLAATLRDVYSAATIYCGHVGVTDYPVSARARSRGEWYAMQVEATHDFEVPLPVSQLCGALDRQIEHHLFPRLPTNRLREIAPAVRALCEAHGVEYHTDTWGRTLRRVFARIGQLSRPEAPGRPGLERPAT